jgi:hypothetical protein
MQKIMGEMFQLLKVSRFSWRCAQNKVILSGDVSKGSTSQNYRENIEKSFQKKKRFQDSGT